MSECCGCTPSSRKIVDIEDFRTRVSEIIEKIRPGLQMDGGDITLIDVNDSGEVQVSLTGACSTCPHAQMTLKMGIEYALKEEVPEVSAVIAV